MKKVLLPVDLCVNRPTLTAFMQRMLDRPDYEIVLLHVIEEAPRSRRGNDIQRAVAQLEFLLRRDFSLARAGLRVERGQAAERILQYARVHTPDLIVLPAGSQSRPWRHSLGHVATELLLGWTGPVWLEWMTETGEYERQICCTVQLADFASDAAAVRRAAAQSAELDSVLKILPAASAERVELADTVRGRLEVLRDRFAPHALVHTGTRRLRADFLVTSRPRAAAVAAGSSRGETEASVPAWTSRRTA